MKKLTLAAVGVFVVTTLTGCAGSAATIPVAPVVKAAPSGFVERETVDGIPVELRIEPFQVGENQFVVTTSPDSVASVETQVIMLSMGHGQVVSMADAGSGRFEATSPAIEMDGKWMLRVKLKTRSGEEKQATFYGKVGAQQ